MSQFSNGPVDDDQRESQFGTGPIERPAERLMVFFNYEHLPEPLAEVSKQFHDLAKYIVDNIPASPERTTSLRFLMSSKDDAVRAKGQATWRAK